MERGLGRKSTGSTVTVPSPRLANHTLSNNSSVSNNIVRIEFLVVFVWRKNATSVESNFRRDICTD